MIAPQWLIDKIKAARAAMQKDLNEAQRVDPNPARTLETRLRIGNYDEILGWMEQAERAEFAEKLRLKYK
jgi:cell division inhibitor SulA